MIDGPRRHRRQRRSRSSVRPSCSSTRSRMPSGADVVDHELQPRLDARDAVAQVVAPDVHDRARAPRAPRPSGTKTPRSRAIRGTEESPPPTRRAKPSRPSCCAPMSAMQLISGALHCAAQAAIVYLVLARQVREVAGCRRRTRPPRRDRRAVEQLVGVEPGDRAAGDVAHGVAAAAGVVMPGRVQLGEDVRQLRRAGASAAGRSAAWTVRCTPSPYAVRRPRRSRGAGPRQDAARDLDAQHERADLRLVVVQPVPLEADDVLFGDRSRSPCAISAGSSSRMPSGAFSCLMRSTGFRLDEVPGRGFPRAYGSRTSLLQRHVETLSKVKELAKGKLLLSWNCQDARMIELRRISDLPPYAFAEIDRLKLELRRAGDDVVELGFGNPDIASPPIAVEKLAEAARSRGTIATPRAAGSRSSARRSAISTHGASVSSSIRSARRSRPSVQRKASLT